MNGNRAYRSCEFEMVISTENYFKKKSRQMEKQNTSDIVIRFKMEDDNKKYHIP